MICVQDKENCSGCMACSNICPSNCINMISDKEGFWYPKVQKNKCINCGLCEKVCPQLNIFHNEAAKDNPKCLAAWNMDKALRKDSSSGGVFTSLAQWILKVDGVVFGAAFDRDFNVVHKETLITEGLTELRGSKYVQCKINDTYSKAKQYLDGGTNVLFTGTPCQIAGLYNFLGMGYEELYTCDIVCHGVPSPMVFEKYKQNLEKDYNSKIKEINFRNKKYGWKKYSVAVKFNNDTSYSKTLGRDVYMQGFLKNYYLRPSCYKCLYAKIPRVSDITLGDFWGIASRHPELDDDEGTSLLLVNTYKGKAMLEGCKNYIVTTECDLSHAIDGNPSIIKSVKVPDSREYFFKDLNSRDFNYVIKKYMSPPSLLRRKIRFIKKKIIFIKRKVM